MSKYLRLIISLSCAGLIFAFSGCSSALQRAAVKGNTEKLAILLQKQPKPSSKDINNALIEASKNGQDGAVNALLDAGADVNYGNPKTGWTPLTIAARHLHASTVKLLLSRGAEGNAAAAFLEMEPWHSVWGDAGPQLIRKSMAKFSLISLPDTEDNRDELSKCQFLNDPPDSEKFLQCLGTIPGYEINTTGDQSKAAPSSGCSSGGPNFTDKNYNTYAVQFCSTTVSP